LQSHVLEPNPKFVAWEKTMSKKTISQKKLNFIMISISASRAFTKSLRNTSRVTNRCAFLIGQQTVAAPVVLHSYAFFSTGGDFSPATATMVKNNGPATKYSTPTAALDTPLMRQIKAELMSVDAN
jgi:hypothetical protein